MAFVGMALFGSLELPKISAVMRPIYQKMGLLPEDAIELLPDERARRQPQRCKRL
jgi:hypothetical protein